MWAQGKGLRLEDLLITLVWPKGGLGPSAGACSSSPFSPQPRHPVHGADTLLMKGFCLDGSLLTVPGTPACPLPRRPAQRAASPVQRCSNSRSFILSIWLPGLDQNLSQFQYAAESSCFMPSRFWSLLICCINVRWQKYGERSWQQSQSPVLCVLPAHPQAAWHIADILPLSVLDLLFIITVFIIVRALQSCQHPALSHIWSGSNCPHCSHHTFFFPKAIMFEKKIISSLVDFTFISLSFPFNGSFCYVITFNLETSGQIKDLAFVKPLGIFMWTLPAEHSPRVWMWVGGSLLLSQGRWWWSQSFLWHELCTCLAFRPLCGLIISLNPCDPLTYPTVIPNVEPSKLKLRDHHQYLEGHTRCKPEPPKSRALARYQPQMQR